MNTRHFTLRSLFLSFLATGALILPVVAQAALFAFNFPLTESETVPRSGASGSGSCDVELNDVSGAVSVSCSFSGLDSDATAAHIHGLAPADVAAGVILPLTATTATSGTITGNGVLTPDQVQGVLDGLTYVNLHTVNDSPGALRGQIVGGVTTSTSLPATSTAFLVALGALLLLVGGLVLRRNSSRI